MPNLESGKQMDVLILDFSKAFNGVNHSLLLHKLQRYGIQGTTNTWVSSFLYDRCQQWWWMDLNPPLSASDQESPSAQC